MLHLKGVPLLEADIHRWMRIWEARHIMTREPVVFNEHEEVTAVLDVLAQCTHNGFPVVRDLGNGKHHFLGLVLRSQLHVLLRGKQFVNKTRTGRSGSQLTLNQLKEGASNPDTRINTPSFTEGDHWEKARTLCEP